jgi:hypothetical protein
MIHSSWVWVACVLRTRSGMATLSDAMAAETAPRATHTTTVMAERLIGFVTLAGAVDMVWISCIEGIFVL